MKITTKVIKLNNRFKLYKEYKMEHAIRFSYWNPTINKVESFMRLHFGSEYSWSQTQWKTHWGKSVGDNPRPFFIGVRDKEIIFMAQLAGVI